MSRRISMSIRLAAILAALVTSAGLARADYVLPLNMTTVAGTDSTGTMITVTGGPYSANTQVNFSATGTVNLDTGAGSGPYTVNAAGVLTQQAGPAHGSAAAGTFQNAPNGLPYGAVLIGNSTLGFFQLFPTSAQNGAGTAPNPTGATAVATTLGAIFGSGVMFGPTTTLFLRVNDTQYADNSGSFAINGSLVNPVPEPTSVILMGLGAVALVGFRLRQGLLRAAV